MDVGIGLPVTIPGVAGKTVTEWARRAEQQGLTSLGVIDRLAYPNYEPMIALGAAAAVTERVQLMSTILLAPLRSTGLLAKQAATLDVLSGGRFTLGVAVGGRPDDYAVGDADFSGRGRAFDAQLDQMRQIWRGEADPGLGPQTTRADGPELIVGGAGAHTVRRVVEHANGWIAAGGGPDAFTETADAVRAAWAEAGREGRPRLLALGYFSLGPDARAHAESYITDYYGFLGPYASQFAASVPVEPGALADIGAAYDDVGCDELVLFPCSTGLEQVELLAEVFR